MGFLRGVGELQATLVHHTGSMIRFVPSQLSFLPKADVDCQVTLLDGTTVEGRFHLNRANPYIGGRLLVRWIKTWTRWNQPVDVMVEQVGRGNRLRLRMLGTRPAATQERRQVRRGALRLASVESTRRRREYSAWERDPALRRVVLQAWPQRCQVRGCPSSSTIPPNLLPSVLEVHHVVYVSAGGLDSPLNICLLCANHHTLIHRAPTSEVQRCDAEGVNIAIDGIALAIDRDVAALWKLIDV